jgi:hypothetical protein
MKIYIDNKEHFVNDNCTGRDLYRIIYNTKIDIFIHRFGDDEFVEDNDNILNLQHGQRFNTSLKEINNS